MLCLSDCSVVHCRSGHGEPKELSIRTDWLSLSVPTIVTPDKEDLILHL
jgi:hypothetical protein